MVKITWEKIKPIVIVGAVAVGLYVVWNLVQKYTSGGGQISGGGGGGGGTDQSQEGAQVGNIPLTVPSPEAVPSTAGTTYNVYVTPTTPTASTTNIGQPTLAGTSGIGGTFGGGQTRGAGASGSWGTPSITETMAGRVQTVAGVVTNPRGALLSTPLGQGLTAISAPIVAARNAFTSFISGFTGGK